MKAKMLLIMTVFVMAISVPAFAGEDFKGLAPMTVDGLCAGATNLDVAVVALATRPHKVVAGGAKGICIAGDAVMKTSGMLIKGCADGLWTAGTNLDVAVVAVATKPVETVSGGLNLLGKGVDGIFRCVFGPPRRK